MFEFLPNASSFYALIRWNFLFETLMLGGRICAHVHLLELARALASPSKIDDDNYRIVILAQ